MIAANTSYNPNRHQFKPEYVKEWNEATPSARKKLLSDAGYPSGNTYAHRGWAFIPAHVREDVIAVIKHNNKAKITSSEPTGTAHTQWWNTGSME